MRRLMVIQEWDEIARLGHRLKGNGTSYGFMAFTEIGADIEREALRRSAANLEPLIEEYAETLASILEIVQLSHSTPNLPGHQGDGRN